MANIQYAKLVLKTYDLETGNQTQIGDCSVDRNQVTFNNIDLRNLLGDMYDKFDTFNLSLNTFSSAAAPALIGTDINDTQLLLKISGLPWLNQSYNQPSGNKSNSVLFASVYFVASVCTYQTFQNNYITFAKNQEKVNITIEYIRVFDGLSPATELPQACFIFDIIGVKEKDKNGSRLYN